MNNQSTSDPNGPLQRPRSPRVPVNFSLVVAGQTATGEQFEINAAAVRISRGGATLALDVQVDVGARLLLTPPFGKKIEGEVNGVWLDETDGTQRVGVRLLDAHGWFAE